MWGGASLRERLDPEWLLSASSLEGGSPLLQALFREK